MNPRKQNYQKKPDRAFFDNLRRSIYGDVLICVFLILAQMTYGLNPIF